MTWFVCTISPSEPRNWDLCKEFGLWGYTRGVPKCEPGDRLLYWVGRKGYIGYGLVTDYPRRPTSRAEAPWAGGTTRFTAVVPMKVLLEVKDPIHLQFERNVQTDTGLNTGHFQRGMSVIPDAPAIALTERLMDRYLQADPGMEQA